MERVIVKQLILSNPNQQILFQMRLPRDSKRITGICVTTITNTKGVRGGEVGWLWLSTPSMGETFYSEILRGDTRAFDLNGFPNIYQPGLDAHNLWMSGSKIGYSTVNRPVSDTLVEGFYSDKRTFTGKYVVTIYLKIEL